MRIMKKILSLKKHFKGRIYSKSEEWKKHPLNISEDPINYEPIDKELFNLNVPVVDFCVQPDEFSLFRNKIKFGPLYALRCRDKKILEHFIAFKLLNLQSGDTYIDVGSQDSPFSKALLKLGIDAYSQDIEYSPGLHKRRIGSSADNMPIANSSVDKVSLQCAFEHFNGRVDTNFIYELSRILCPHGKCCIVPLYLANIFTNYIDPLYDYSAISLDDGAKVIGEINLGGIFERKYSVDALKRRILLMNIGLKYMIFKIRNANLVSESPLIKRVRYALLIEKY